MTSFAFVLGTVPLAIATGASANSRHSIGTGVIGGTLAATVIAIFFIPMFYWSLQTLSAKFSGGPKSQASPTPELQGTRRLPCCSRACAGARLTCAAVPV